jgi:gliding motility-associated-like protein
VEVVIYEIPEIQLSTVGEILICEGGQYTINSTEGFAEYTWYHNGMDIEGQTGSSITIYEEGAYTVSAIDTNGCVSISSDTLNVFFGNNPEPQIILPYLVVCPSIGHVELEVDDGYALYQWYHDGDLLEGEEDYILEINENGEYIVMVGDGAGCFGSDTAWVELTFAGVDRDTIYREIVKMEGERICLEQEDVLELMGDFVSYEMHREPEHVTYDIDFRSNSVCIGLARKDKEANLDTMIISIADNSVCELIDTTVIILILPDIDDPPNAVEECVEVNENGQILIDVLLNDTDPDGDILTVTGIVSGPQHGTASIEEADNSIRYIPDQDYCGADTLYYEVCDIDQAGCDTAFVCIKVLCDCWIPNVLTPNNDLLNDYFFVECLQQIEGAILRVYNRWGNEVFRSDDYRNNWNGNYKGKALPEGTYFYVIKFFDHDGDRIDLAGHLTILR